VAAEGKLDCALLTRLSLCLLGFFAQAGRLGVALVELPPQYLVFQFYGPEFPMHLR
jgi:hypothetical protein